MKFNLEIIKHTIINLQSDKISHSWLEILRIHNFEEKISLHYNRNFKEDFSGKESLFVLFPRKCSWFQFKCLKIYNTSRAAEFILDGDRERIFNDNVDKNPCWYCNPVCDWFCSSYGGTWDMYVFMKTFDGAGECICLSLPVRCRGKREAVIITTVLCCT